MHPHAHPQYMKAANTLYMIHVIVVSRIFVLRHMCTRYISTILRVGRWLACFIGYGASLGGPKFFIVTFYVKF